MKRSLHISWLLLIFLTTAAYVVGLNRGPEASLWFLIPLALAGIKISVIAWYFMELRTVSRLWTVGLGLLTTGILVLVAILQWQAGESLL